MPAITGKDEIRAVFGGVTVASFDQRVEAIEGGRDFAVVTAWYSTTLSMAGQEGVIEEEGRVVASVARQPDGRLLTTAA